MPRISVVLPVYNVEPYLAECLDSVLAQTFGDLEVIVVDDGSTDSSPEIAAAYAERDRRIRIVRQANHGLGHARNTGVDAAGGELLAFCDSDDVVPRDAYATLVRSLDWTRSDFATGNIHRFDGTRTWPAPFVAKAFWRGRFRTHVTRLRWLVVDRMAQNKLWRRSFWDEHGLRFPEGMVHEDIPVVIPAHFLARAVDVVAEPVYLYRQRPDGGGAITQRRTDPRALLDRLAAIEHVDAFLERHGPRGARRAYAESVVAQDLLYHLDVLEDADERFRRVFLDRANAFLDRAGDVEAPLPPIQRLKWHLVRRRLLPELLEVLRFAREHPGAGPTARRGARAYGDYPFLDDPALAVPRSVYRLDTTRRRAGHAVSYARSYGPAIIAPRARPVPRGSLAPIPLPAHFGGSERA